MKLLMLDTTYEVESVEDAEHLIQAYCDENGFSYKRELFPNTYKIVEVNVDDEGNPFEYLIDIVRLRDE